MPNQVRLSRRSFVRLLALGMGGLVTACLSPATPPTSAPPPATPAPSATSIPSPTSPSPSRRRALVGVARHPEVAAMVRQAVERAGGLTGLKRGMRVLIKPNVNSNDPYPGTTNPAVLAAVVALVKDYGPSRIVVGDRSNPSYGTLQAMKTVGLYQAAQEAGAEVVALEDGPWQRVTPLQAEHWAGGFEIPQLLSEIDYLITMPVVKTHFIATYSMALKNSVGLIHPRSRSELHRAADPSFGAMIAEIHLARRPDFVVLDGTRVIVEGGPARGKTVEAGLVLASADVVAIDATGLALLKTLGSTPGVMGRSVWQQPQVSRAVALRLGATAAQDVAIEGQGVPEVATMMEHLV